MVVEDTGDLGDVADGKADEHGALGLKPIRSPCLSDFAARVETVFGGRGRALLPLAGEGGPAEPGRMRVLGKAAGKFELLPLTPISRASILAKPQNQGGVPRRTFARKIPIFSKALDLERNS